MARVLISAEDRRRLMDVTRRANYGVTFKDLAWLLRMASRLLAERDELLERGFPVPPPEKALRRSTPDSSP
jgi:hypothetical protein